MAKKLNGSLKYIIAVVGIGITLVTIVWGSGAWHKEVETKVGAVEEDVKTLTTIAARHEERLDGHDVAMVEIKYIREDMAEQKTEFKEFRTEVKDGMKSILEKLP